MTAAGAVYLNRGARDVTVDDAVEQFRHAASEPSTTAAPDATARPEAERAKDTDKRAEPAAAAATPEGAGAEPAAEPFEIPQEGVYTYATEGYEQTDALSGQRHDYPSETAVTIRKGGCGWTSRWAPLRERWEENEICEKPAGSFMARYTMHHEFFQRGVTDQFTCDGYVQRPDVKAGESWTFGCKSKGTTGTSTNTVVGFETITVDGTAVKTVHMRYAITAKGDNEGTIVQDRWLGLEPRSLVRLTQKADLKVASPFGKVNYAERFRIDLTSLEPKR
jgi:hypothetical protein